jgi:hypothetical protein
MTMTRQHFELIAATIRSLGGFAEGVFTDAMIREIVAKEFADALAGTNPWFDRERFVKAATQ